MTSVVITGGAGFIGKHLSRRLVNESDRLTIVDRASRPSSLPVSTKVSYKRLDAYNINSIYSQSFRHSRMIHLAAETSVEDSVRAPMSTVRSNIGVTCAALEFARRIDCSRFVFASTAAVYGDRRGRCRELDAPAPRSPYAVSKLACEYYCKLYDNLYGIPTVILRFFNVFGPEQSGEYAGVITRFIERAMIKKPPVIFGDGRQTRDFVFVDDVVDATLTALKGPVSGGSIVNIGSGKPLSIKSLASIILELFNLDHLRPVHRPPRPGDIRHSLANISKARKKLHFLPQYDLERGLLTTIDWFRGKD